MKVAALLVASGAAAGCAVAGMDAHLEARREASATADTGLPGLDLGAEASVPEAGPLHSLPEAGPTIDPTGYVEDAGLSTATPDAGDTEIRDAAADADITDSTLDADLETGDVASQDAAPVPSDAGAGSALDAAEAGSPEEEGCSPGADSDGDSLFDCAELGDDDPFTDPTVFNGVRVQTRNHSYTAPACFLMDTVGEVRGLLNGPPDQELDQYAGWDFDDMPDNRTHPGYGFLPPWTVPSLTWQIDAVGYVQLEAGRHCFEIAGRVDQACGTLFIANTKASEFGGWDSVQQGSAAVAKHGAGAGCFDAPAGVYPIRWHYEMDDQHVQEFHLRYCHGGDGDCSPQQALPSGRLRVVP